MRFFFNAVGASGIRASFFCSGGHATRVVKIVLNDSLNKQLLICRRLLVQLQKISIEIACIKELQLNALLQKGKVQRAGILRIVCKI